MALVSLSIFFSRLEDERQEVVRSKRQAIKESKWEKGKGGGGEGERGSTDLETRGQSGPGLATEEVGVRMKFLSLTHMLLKSSRYVSSPLPSDIRLSSLSISLASTFHHVVEDGDHDVPQIGLRHQRHLQERTDHRRDEVQLVFPWRRDRTRCQTSALRTMSAASRRLFTTATLTAVPFSSFLMSDSMLVRMRAHMTSLTASRQSAWTAVGRLLSVSLTKPATSRTVKIFSSSP
ncbi:hypothetical protein EYF80_023443 [Liparis tanakae]|uniref:Uncharacterized protein n=1 Tax=Liparis tanakae TaxID=230148 RepID=A0A4Z2HKR3_9TELE|nr:hypothetical protein EYF80_023443 [Liparis tanakae]